MEQALPDPQVRKITLSCLLRSVQVVEAIAPNAWSVTLFSDGFCLNVGKVEALILRGGTLRANVSGKFGTGSFKKPRFRPVMYVSQPTPHCSFEISSDEFNGMDTALEAGHHRFIELAAIRKNGSAFSGALRRNSHSANLLMYAKNFVSGLADQTESDSIWMPSEEFEGSEVFFEGATRTVQVNAYERNAGAREACLSHHGLRCVVCKFDFEAVYGLAGRGYIQVHHTFPLADRHERYQVDPINDLIPICANCHAIVHRRTPPYNMDEMIAMLKKRRAKQ